MNDFLIQNIITFLLGGGVSSFVTLKFTRKEAEAKALSSIQDVYQEVITDLKSYNTELKKDKEDIESRLSVRIQNLEERQSRQDKKIEENEREISTLKHFKCTDLSCLKRRQ
ncbi:hypothetical protein IX307_001176 [Bacteroides pyogenes]|uniref:Uncharacterized protein n=2 Tax=Bacteroides pyogenes TaxID=310300 RepID=A0A5D3E917_9BACE|nr:hypothetical protein [Bacteroides pyogenes]MBR8719937.1 hypothetical protein [Bacteroides pyogenes]MBR8786862.1 hypothetical protein [Bacteroides pyogenes]MBR8792347.1 hypothetical protein [Bacteroides pyogenes]TYK32392.1 hypothetical protein FNJ60_12260 [Bacteroides pyogenes]